MDAIESSELLPESAEGGNNEYENPSLARRVIHYVYTAPWWLIVLFSIGILLAISINRDEIYSRIWDQLKDGISMTLGVSAVSYFFALMIALIVGIIRVNPPQPPDIGASWRRGVGRTVHVIFYNIASVYVNVMRGLPVLVVLLVAAFVVVPMIRDDVINAHIVPLLRQIFNNPDIPNLVWRGSSAPSAIMALALTYGAYMSETIRAGIQSIPKGQVEAAKSLGMTYFQVMRYIVLPQAFRVVIPPLGNDFVAMIKDSSLLAILGVRDITQIAKESSGRSFRYLETYAVVAILYLSLTITGSTIVRALEDAMREDRSTPRWLLTLGQIRDVLTGRARQRRQFWERHQDVVGTPPKK